jgi:hypothetical protein
VSKEESKEAKGTEEKAKETERPENVAVQRERRIRNISSKTGSTWTVYQLPRPSSLYHSHARSPGQKLKTKMTKTNGMTQSHGSTHPTLVEAMQPGMTSPVAQNGTLTHGKTVIVPTTVSGLSVRYCVWTILFACNVC